MANPDGGSGCSSCAAASQNGTKFQFAISLGAVGNASAGQILFNGDLAQADLLKLTNLSTQAGVGTLTGSVSSGVITAYQDDGTTPTASVTIQKTMGSGGVLDSVTIVVTPLPAGSGVASTHSFTRVSAPGGMVGVNYTRTEAGSPPESMAFYNMGVDAAFGAMASGVFALVKLDGSTETWTAPPEVTAGAGGTPTFSWVNSSSHVNGGYFAGTAVETHEITPADASQPKVLSVRTYGRIGTQDRFLRVLLSEEVSQIVGTTTASTAVTRYGYDEVPFLFISTSNPLGTSNTQFGQRLWTLSEDGTWTLSMGREVPWLVPHWMTDPATGLWTRYEEVEFYYGGMVEFSPWLDGPSTSGADLQTQSGATAFFNGLMAEARSNGWQIAGCRSSCPMPKDGSGLWKEMRNIFLGGIKQGVEYSYDSASSYLYLPDGVGTFGLPQAGDRWLSLSQRTERWNATETSGAWSASIDAASNAGIGVSLNQTGVARIDASRASIDGSSVENTWQVIATADGTYDAWRRPPSYSAVAEHPLWSTTSTDEQGRTVSEVTKFGESGATIQTITTTYSGDTGYTRSAGGVTLASQSDATASGLSTSTSTDSLGITTTTVTDASSGELISTTRLGVTTSYAKTTATGGNTTQTVTQSAGGASRTVSVTVTDALGHTLSSTDANGGVTTYSYANNGRTVTETLPGGGTRITQTYLDGHVKSITGTAVTPEYHTYTVNAGGAGYEAGSITEKVYYGSSSGPVWRSNTTNYLGQVLREEAPSPTGSGVSLTLYSYNDKGQQVKVSCSGMADIIIAYDDWGRASQQGYDMNADGALTASSTDVLIASSTDYVQAEGTVLERVVRQQYTQDGGTAALQTVSERKLLQGASWQRSTQADGGVFTQFDVLSGSIRTVHGQQSVTGTQSQIQIYQNGLLMSETPPGMTQAVTYAYDGFGQMTQTVHPLSGTITATYDSAGRLQTQGQSGGDTLTYAYNSQGQVTSVTHSDSSTTTYTYDAQGRVLTQGGSAGYPLSYDYDSMGRLWKLHTYRGGGADDVTTWSYDAASGVLLSKTDAAGRSVSYTYDAAGRVLTRTWARGITTTYGYDGAGRQTSITYSDGTPAVSIAYDRVGRRTTTTDAAGSHSFTYDAASGGQGASWSVGGSGAWSGLSVGYGYTSGQRSSRATSLGGIALPTAGYTYDSSSGRMASVSSSDFTTTYRYNSGTGWNEGVTYSSGLSSTRTPDALGRLDAITWTSGGAVVSAHDYTLDAMNRRTAAQRQDGSAWGYGYNSRGEVTSAGKAGEPGKQFAFAYDGMGNRTTSSVSSVADGSVLRSTSYSANASNQYESITHPSPGWMVLRGSVNATPGVTVTVDGNPPTQRSGTLWNHEQSVDNSAGPVRREVTISATRPDGGRKGGPVTTQQKGSLFIPPAGEVPTYDQDGNQTSDARWIYVWDGENRLIAMEEKPGFTVQPTSSTPVKRVRLEFAYDVKGRRITKRVLSATGSSSFVLQQALIHLYDGWNMIGEIDITNSAQLLRSYEWGMDISGTLSGAGGVGGLLVERFYAPSSPNPHLPSPGAHAPCYDGNGNVTELVNLATASISARYEYGAFGETISTDGGAVAQANPFRFSTKYLGAEIGLYNYGYRYYDAVSGRWLSKDPAWEEGGVNLYGMVANDPVNHWDYLGLATVEITLTRGQTGYFAVYGRLTASLSLNESEKQRFACCQNFFPKSYLTMESSDIATITPPGEYTPYFAPENSGGGKGSTSIKWKLQRGLAASPAWWSDEDVQAAMPAKPAYMSDKDYQEILNLEFHIGWSGNGGGNNVHLGPTSNHSDGCVLVGTQEVMKRSRYNFSRHSELVEKNGKDAVYQAPAFELQDTVNSQFTLLEAIQCARKKGATVKFRVTNAAKKRDSEATAIPERPQEPNAPPIAEPADNF